MRLPGSRSSTTLWKPPLMLPTNRFFCGSTEVIFPYPIAFPISMFRIVIETDRVHVGILHQITAVFTGPGCSSMGIGAFQEIGPFRVDTDGKTLCRNPHSWITGQDTFLGHVTLLHRYIKKTKKAIVWRVLSISETAYL